MLARLLWSEAPCCRDLLRSRAPRHHPRQLNDAADTEDCEEYTHRVADTDDAPVPEREPQQQQQQQRSPDDAKDQNDALRQRERTHCARALQQIRRRQHHHHQPHPRVVRGTCRECQYGKQSQSEQQNVRNLRQTYSRQRIRNMHAHICSATQQLPIIDHKDQRRQSDALAKSLKNVATFSACPIVHPRASPEMRTRRCRVRPLPSVSVRAIENSPSHAATRSRSLNDP